MVVTSGGEGFGCERNSTIEKNVFALFSAFNYIFCFFFFYFYFLVRSAKLSSIKRTLIKRNRKVAVSFLVYRQIRPINFPHNCTSPCNHALEPSSPATYIKILCILYYYALYFLFPPFNFIDDLNYIMFTRGSQERNIYIMPIYQLRLLLLVKYIV